MSRTASGSERRPPLAVRFVPFVFASVGTEQRTRRPVDVAVVLICTVLVAAAGGASSVDPPDVDLPAWCEDLAWLLFAATVVYGIGVVVLSVLARDRPALTRDLAFALAGVVATGVLVGRAVEGDWPAALGFSDDATYPILRLASISAVLATARPHLVVPARRLGWLLLAGGALASVALELGSATDVIGAVALGFGVAALVHLVWGSPVGAPPAARVRHALEQLGVDVVTMDPDPVRHRGVAVFHVVDADGRPVRVKVYGRDASDTRLLANLWRLIWYRDRTSTLAVTRRQQAEHEALATILARRAGASVPDVVVAGASSRGDAIVATDWTGRPFGDGDLTDERATDLWHTLERLTRGRIAHGRIEPDRIRLVDDALVLTDWDDSTVGAGDERLRADGASLLVTTAVMRGVPDAVAIASGALPRPRLAAIVPLLQPAAVSSGLRRRAKDADLDLDDLRRAVADEVAVEAPELAKLRRVTLGSVLTLAAALLGGTILLSSLADVGWDSIRDAVSNASPGWLVAALVVGQLPRVGQAFSTIGASPKVLPLGPTTLLQMAITFINLVIPSAPARVATVVRYQQRFGVAPGEAVVAGALDSFAGFLVQAVLLVLGIVFGLSSLELDLEGAGSDALEVILVVLGVCVLAAVGSLLIGRVRRALVEGLRTALGGVRRLRDPQRAIMVFGGNLAAEVLFATTLGLMARAFGYEVGLAELITINVSVSLVGGLMPIPGGMGVVESGLSLGLVAAGLPEVDALAVALCYRAVTFYLPPIWGAVALRWLRRHDYL